MLLKRPATGVCVAALCLVLCCLAGACADTRHRAIQAGAAQGFAPFRCKAAAFAFAGQLKAPVQGATELVVYIEGDGHISAPDGSASADPTPNRPIAWDLARLDPASAVFYLPRLGQFDPECTGPRFQIYWTNKRFAPEIVAAMNTAVTRAREHTGAKAVHLVGFSGGGAIACLLAAERNDVASLVTVAGLLDHEYWTGKNGYKPLSGSLNPARKALQLARIPQLHLYGTKDRVIDPSVSAHFLQEADFVEARRMGVDAGHNEGWAKAWPGLLAGPVQAVRQ